MIQGYFWVLIFITFIGSSFIPFSNVSIAQNTAIAPIYIDRAIYKAAQEGLICSKETIDKLDPAEVEARKKACGIDLEIKSDIDKVQASTAEPENQVSTNEPSSNKVVNSDGEEVSLVPGVDFIDEYVITFGDGKPRDTIFFGGVVPFVALPDSELITEDSFFNEDSFSVFFYLKRKF